MCHYLFALALYIKLPRKQESYILLEPQAAMAGVILVVLVIEFSDAPYISRCVSVIQ